MQPSKNNTPEKLLESKSIKAVISLLREYGVKKVASSLTVKEVGWILVGLYGVVGVLAGWIGIVLDHRSVSPDDLVPCYQAEGYPVGEWLQSGITTTYNVAKFPPNARPGVAHAVRFLDKTTASVLTDENNASGGTETIVKGKMGSNESVILRGTDGSGYIWNVRGTVSSDGCSVATEWDDNNKDGGEEEFKQKGEATLFWFNRKNSYWVKRGQIEESGDR